MASISNPPETKIESNIKLVEAQWAKMLANRAATLLENMQRVTYLLKETIAHTKLEGQVLRKRTGHLIASLLPNSPEVAGRIVSEGVVVGTVGAQGAIAPYAKPLEEGRAAFIVRPKPGRIGLHGRPAALRFMAEGRVIYRRSANIPAMPGRWYIKNTIIENEARIRQMLGTNLVRFD